MYNRNEIIGRSLEFFANAKNRDDRSFSTPAASSLQRHSEPQAKNPEKIILDNRILRYAPAQLRMTIHILILAAVLSTTLASESWAATSGCDCGSTANGGSASDCCWKIEDGVLTIYPNPSLSSGSTVTMQNFNYSWSSANKTNDYTSSYASTAPWARQNVTSVVVENGISNIGKNAFAGETKITGVTGMENVTSIGETAFIDTKSLQSIDTPNVTSIGRYAFSGAKSLQIIDIPNVTSIGEEAFNGASSVTDVIISDDVNADNLHSSAFNNLANGAKFRCLGDINNCYQKLAEYFSSSSCPSGFTCNCGGTRCIAMYQIQSPTVEQCNSSASYYSTNDGCVKLPSTQSACEGAEFYWVSDKCTKTAPASSTTPNEGNQGGSEGSQVSGQATSAADCPNGASIGGECFPRRYTPAEIAELVGESNTILLYYK